MSANRTAVITGSASGIGHALVLRLLNDGWNVCGIDQQTRPDSLPSPYTHYCCDLTNAAEIEALAPQLPACVHAVVHSAGVMRSGGTQDSQPQDTSLLWRLHCEAPMTLVRILAPRLADKLGRIVLVSSRAVLGRAQRAGYAASKAAQIGLARSWASELIGRGITVNVVAPGAVDTPMLRDPARGLPPSVNLPLGRLIHPDEVASTIEFFLSHEAGAITGQTLYVCGGASLGINTI